MEKAGRVYCIDVVRGLDMFFLVGLETVMYFFFKGVWTTAPDWFRLQWGHEPWQGFVLWDLIMPLFLFITGAAMPFALAKYKSAHEVGGRVIRRFLVLWVFGMIAQGNLLALDPSKVYLFSNTLQAIAVGYLVAVLPVLKMRWKGQLALAVSLLVAFWALMTFVSVGGFGGGDWTPAHNLAEGVDRWVLGRFRDASSVGPDGAVIFNPSYHYTWILSSLGFAATVLSGVLAGDVLKSVLSPARKAFVLFGAGVVCVALGWGLDLAGIIPVIKPIWAPSMVLVSSGYCLLLLGFFFVACDIWQVRRGTGFLVMVGQNALLAYMLPHVFNLEPVAHNALQGIEHWLPVGYGPFLDACGAAAILFFILWVCRRLGWFLKA